MGRTFHRPPPSKFELEVGAWLAQFEEHVQAEYTLPNNLLGKKRFDFYLPKFNLLIEADGDQHFRANSYFHANKQNFHIYQATDRLKTWAALNLGFRIARIDYTWWKGRTADKLAKLARFIQSEDQMWVSSFHSYKHLNGKVWPSLVDKHVNLTFDRNFRWSGYCGETMLPDDIHQDVLIEPRQRSHAPEINCCTLL